MKRQAVWALALFALPALAEPYRPLPRHAPGEVRQRAAVSRAAQSLHHEPPDQAVVTAEAEPDGPTHPAQRDPPPRSAVHEDPAPGLASGSSLVAPTPSPKAARAELKVSVGQARADGGFVMLVEDPSGARIELLLDPGGRLLSVQPAGSL